ncbi:MAG: pitrilysin family protein [Oscillospiraceae bacterium]|nr:pitrilysin family protein [Oscillospiraceae bacterium]MDY6208723.1 pitrilysin family protein [Oscillospiraceae bacterium]
MTKEIISNARTGEKYTRVLHDSGLEILIWKTEGHSVKHALFGTRYGSVNTTFKTSDDPDFVTVPNGIAHYLEHKLFENEDCDVFDLYAQTGASGNAYTSFDRTCYLFSCTDNFIPSLRILLDFVQKPYFTEETVRKEQGIIGQEIRMYDDSPDWKVFFNLLEGIYHENPVRIDIAGTQESIAMINADLLYRCYNTFYNLHNMVLAIAGDVDEDEILSVCDELLKPCENKNLISIVPEEPDKVKDSYKEQSFEVAVPMFNLGFKSKPVSNEDIVRETVLCNMAEELLMGETSELYKTLYDGGLINSAFYFETFSGDGFFVPIFGGESRDPEKVREMLNDEIKRRMIEGFDPESFEIAKKHYYGSLIKGLGSPESIASGLINAGLRGTGDAFSVIEAVAGASLEDVNACLKTRFDTDNSTLSVIRPITK